MGFDDVLAMGFADVCLLFFFFGSGGFDECGCGWVCD